jgi:hypothetical protein
MKPNNAKVIVIFNKLQWKGFPVDLAVPVGKRIPPRSLNWLRGFAEQHGRPLIFTAQTLENGEFQKQQQVSCYGPPAFQQDLLRWQREGKKLW